MRPALGACSSPRPSDMAKAWVCKVLSNCVMGLQASNLAFDCRRRWSRKTAAQRAKRMAGQGLGPLMNKKPDIMIAPPSRALARLPRRDSPTYDPYRCCKRWRLLPCKSCHLPVQATNDMCTIHSSPGYIIGKQVLQNYGVGIGSPCDVCSPQLQVQALLVCIECFAIVLTAARPVLAGEAPGPDRGLNQGRPKLRGRGQSTSQSSRPPRGAVTPMARLAVHPLTCLRPNGR